MTQPTIWRDGAFVAWQDATVHVLAQSLQRGSLAFDYISVHDTPKGVAVFRLRDHIERLATTCGLVGLPLKYGVGELVEACAETVRRNPGATSIKISALIPSVEVELIPQDERVSVFVAAYDGARDIIARNPGEYRARPELSLAIVRGKAGRREDVLTPQAKVAANYTAAMAAKWQARRAGYDDVILLDENGLVAEAPTANIFVVDAEGALATPPEDNVLLGITRDSIIELARAADIPCAIRALHPDELLKAREAFLTSTSAGVWPVLGIDGNPVGNGGVGAVTSLLRQRYNAAANAADDAFAHWLHFV